jgi:hypothetical protein
MLRSFPAFDLTPNHVHVTCIDKGLLYLRHQAIIIDNLMPKPTEENNATKLAMASEILPPLDKDQAHPEPSQLCFIVKI